LVVIEMAKGFRELVGAPPSTASTSDSALIIIDAQNEYCPLSFTSGSSQYRIHPTDICPTHRYAQGALATVDVSSTRAAIATLLEKYRKGGKPENIVHVVHIVPDGAPVFTPGTELAEEFQELSPKEGEKVIKKNFPSSFAGTGLKEYLDGLGIKKVVLVGYMVSFVCGIECGVGREG
jgi:nicotinamidase-related amidase